MGRRGEDPGWPRVFALTRPSTKKRAPIDSTVSTPKASVKQIAGAGLVGILIAIVAVIAKSPTSKIPEPVGVPGVWSKLTLDDEFAGTTLNTTRWTTSWFGGHPQNNVTTSPANVKVTGGRLVLMLSSPKVGALVSTNPHDSGTPGHYGHGFQFGDGTYIEARVWLPGSGRTVNDWPAFWVNGQNWPQDGETDIVEGLGTATSNYHSGCPGHPRKDCPNISSTIPGTWAGGWHTYGLDRESGQNKIYWDGRLIRTYKTNDGGTPQYVTINIGAEYGPTVPGDQMKVDYVRVWRHGRGRPYDHGMIQ